MNKAKQVHSSRHTSMMVAKSHRTRYIIESKPWLSTNPGLPRRPLIDYCTNEWRNLDRSVQQPLHTCRRERSNLRQQLKWTLPLKRRWIKWWIATICSTLVLVWWLMGTRSLTAADNTGDGLKFGSESENSAVSGGGFGVNRVPQLEGVTQLGSVDASLLPSSIQSTSDDHKQRVIFIGDIHGCYKELVHLLAESNYNEATDHIITTGDIINKGPDSRGVVDFLISKRASCVRGNHDDRILLKATQQSEQADHQETQDDPEMILARSLTDAQLAYLRSCPVILNVGQVVHHGNVVVVHGGLVPSLELADQDPWAVMNMRIIHTSTHVPSKEHELEGHVPWSNLWNLYQNHQLKGKSSTDHSGKSMLDQHLRTLVVYGHDAKSGLRIQKYTKGLDSGCVRGHKLTALIMSNKSEQEIIQVKCERYA